MSHRRRNQKGSIILIAVILLLVIGAMAFITMTRDRVRNRAFEKTSEIVGVKLLRRYFNIGHDCARTRVLNAGACGAGYIDLGRVGSVTLLVDFDSGASVSATKIGDFWLRAKCTGATPGPLTIRVEYLRKSNNQASTDWKALFATPPVCS